MRISRLLLCAAVWVLPLQVLAEESPGTQAPAGDADAGAASAAPAKASDADKTAAAKAVEEYLNAARDKKWDEVRALTHPRTLEIVADEKKRGLSPNEMDPWAKLDQEYVVSFELGVAEGNAKGSVVVPTTQSRFSVEDNGTEDGVQIEYLVIPLDGKWYVADMRRGTNVFAPDTVPEHYKGYFQGEYKPAPAPPATPKKKKKKHS